MICPNCGNNNADGTRFCSSCGAPMNNGAPNNYQQPNYQQPNYQQPNYQQPNYQQPYGSYRAPVRNRNIVTCILLLFITCGIYGYIWMYNLADDLNTASGRTNDTPGAMVILYSILTCGIYTWIWLYKAGEKVDIIRQHNGEASSNSGLIYLLLAFFGLGIVSYCLMQNELNKVAAM